jgi:hypothetical protein
MSISGRKPYVLGQNVVTHDFGIETWSAFIFGSFIGV